MGKERSKTNTEFGSSLDRNDGGGAQVGLIDPKTPIASISSSPIGMDKSEVAKALALEIMRILEDSLAEKKLVGEIKQRDSEYC
ncbi:hypothetical protein AMTR_s00053p00032610 [Amborella trichopoda]|uniref:Uncharacterized protein n=1 Tax=Amborella trichopoda TaxID=13333 RepID=W1PBM8_AMBTC|nr:hypothetical protein AMTR_s00053p00032610 [Amborella trichopoda]